MDEEPFKLSGDNTMRHLRAVAQSPGELQWRMELIATIASLKTQLEVTTKSIIQTQRATQKSIAHITPTKLAELVNAQIEQKQKEQDSAKYRSGWKSFRNHLVTAVVSIAVGYFLYRLTGK